jgi:maltooligosyltrehalose trehalohydrolase
MKELWTLQRGAQLQPDNSVRFTAWAPRVKQPRVRIGSGSRACEHAMTRVEGEPGVWSVVVPNVGANADYSIVIDDGRALPDPVSRWQPEGVHGPSRVVASDFEWTDDDWRGVTLEDLVMYELHVGTFTPEGTFEAIIPRLADLKALGITAIEIMPVAQFPGNRNWGYDGVGLYAVQNTYGGPQALERLVDAAHAAGLGVVLDVVYNHVGPEGNYLDSFGPYFTEKYKTPWGRALNYDDTDSDNVRRFVVDNALYWVTEYHVDALRLDAVHGIFDFSATHLLQEIAESVHAEAERQGRTVLVIGESDLNDPKLLRRVEEYGYGLDAQWSDDFHHAVHAALTGETNGYYADFGAPAAIADSLREPFVYDGKFSPHRRRRHGGSSAGLPRKRFVVAVQNHDQVGNRATGDRLSATLSPEQLRLAAALLLLSPYVPLIFMGQEYGETNPFQYFISHGDERLVAAVREGRRKEFEAFGWGDDVPDPQSEDTFARSRLEWDKRACDRHEQMLMLYRDLLALRREEPMLRPDGARVSVTNGEPGWIALLREPDHSWDTSAEALLAVFNCSPKPVGVPVPAPDTRAWTLRLSTDAPGYGGSSGVAESVVATEPPDGPRRLLGTTPRSVRLPAWTAAVFAAITNY